MGALLTNFTMIKPGALHRANGGFLLLDAVHVLGRPESWDALKRSLKAGKVIIESVAEAMGLGASAPALEPQPVSLSVKVVLVGEREHYYLLQALVDVERESALGQPLHSKGILILSSYLGARYVPSAPLSLAASLVFEQSYGPVEGDSASLAELCALLSALGRSPLKQALAVTGSVNQFGGMQAVGAINEKVEGFYHLWRARGVDRCAGRGDSRGEPSAPDAACRGRARGTCGELPRLVRGPRRRGDRPVVRRARRAGDSAGCFAPDSFNGRVAQRLEQLSVARQSFALGQHPKLRKARHRAPVAVIHIASDSSQ